MIETVTMKKITIFRAPDLNPNLRCNIVKIMVNKKGIKAGYIFMLPTKSPSINNLNAR